MHSTGARTLGVDIPECKEIGLASLREATTFQWRFWSGINILALRNLSSSQHEMSFRSLGKTSAWLDRLR
jgi:hypothetical protein